MEGIGSWGGGGLGDGGVIPLVCFVRALIFCCIRAHLSARFEGLT